MRSIWRLTQIALVAMLAALAFAGPVAWSADSEVIIRSTALDPHVLLTVAGRRVNFVRRVDRPVHVEFGEDPGRHHVFQMPAAGAIWAIFHRPGTHPYVVHIYDGKTTVLHGVVEVVESPERPWGLGTCGAVVMEECVEP
jgi:hypothetical protein